MTRQGCQPWFKGLPILIESWCLRGSWLRMKTCLHRKRINMNKQLSLTPWPRRVQCRKRVPASLCHRRRAAGLMHLASDQEHGLTACLVPSKTSPASQLTFRPPASPPPHLPALRRSAGPHRHLPAFPPPLHSTCPPPSLTAWQTSHLPTFPYAIHHRGASRVSYAFALFFFRSRSLPQQV